MSTATEVATTAGRAAVLEDGRITELGPHAGLLVAGGPYARLVAAQAVAATTASTAE